MTIRYVVTKVEVCPVCRGAGRIEYDAVGTIEQCAICGGGGAVRTEIDADEWMKAALVRIGLYGDGK